MLKNTQNKDVIAQGFVLRRTNYGEADRILNIITSEGAFAVIARGVRKARSKLAGCVEMFTLAEYHIHLGRNELGVLTGARMMKYYGGIVKDLGRMELAGTMLKRINKVTSSIDNVECFDILKQGMEALDSGERLSLVEAWFWLNVMRIMGEEINVYRDVTGERLLAGQRYRWDENEAALEKSLNGEYGENEIKLLRIMLKGDLSIVRRVKVNEEVLMTVLKVARIIGGANQYN